VQYADAGNVASDASGAPVYASEMVNDAVLLAKGARALKETFAGYTDADFRDAFYQELRNAPRDTIVRSRHTLAISLNAIEIKNFGIAMNAGALSGIEELTKFGGKLLIRGRVGSVFRAIVFASSFRHTPEPTRVGSFTCSAFEGCTGVIRVRR
jgi:hypothetical protein